MNERVAAGVLASLEVGDVLKAYEGGPGCRCGCKGVYRVTEAGRAEASADGVVFLDEEVDDAFVARTLGKIKAGALPLEGAPPLLTFGDEAGAWHLADDLSCVVARCREKVYAVHLTRAARLARGALAQAEL